jgi:predicted nucleic acid-binding protein
MALILFDTNIFIDMLTGVSEATKELSQYDSPGISVITYMEIRSGEKEHEKPILDALLAEFEIIGVSREVTEAAIALRKLSISSPPKIKLPDAIIAATAKVHNIPLVTRNAKDFNKRGIMMHVPYSYDSLSGKVWDVQPACSTYGFAQLGVRCLE